MLVTETGGWWEAVGRRRGSRGKREREMERDGVWQRQRREIRQERQQDGRPWTSSGKDATGSRVGVP